MVGRRGDLGPRDNRVYTFAGGLAARRGKVPRCGPDIPMESCDTVARAFGSRLGLSVVAVQAARLRDVGRTPPAMARPIQDAPPLAARTPCAGDRPMLARSSSFSLLSYRRLAATTRFGNRLPHYFVSSVVSSLGRILAGRSSFRCSPITASRQLHALATVCHTISVRPLCQALGTPSPLLHGDLSSPRTWWPTPQHSTLVRARPSGLRACDRRSQPASRAHHSSGGDGATSHRMTGWQEGGLPVALSEHAPEWAAARTLGAQCPAADSPDHRTRRHCHTASVRQARLQVATLN